VDEIKNLVLLSLSFNATRFDDKIFLSFFQKEMNGKRTELTTMKKKNSDANCMLKISRILYQYS